MIRYPSRRVIPYQDMSDWFPADRLRAFGFPTLQEISRSNQVVKNAVKNVSDYLSAWTRDGEARSLVLLAEDLSYKGIPVMGYGVGKSHMAEVVYRVMGQITSMDNVSSIWETCGAWWQATDLLKVVAEKGQIEDDWLFYTKNEPNVLVIDDWSKGATTQFIGQNLLQRQHYFRNVIDYCVKRDISVVITANGSVSQVREEWGEMAWSRLGEQGRQVVNLSLAPDMRMKKGAGQL